MAFSLRSRRTFTPDPPAPTLDCPVCLRALIYVETIESGLKPPERWDRYTCHGCRRKFEYRQRTRRLRAAE